MIRLPTGRAWKTGRASGTLGALVNNFQSWTIRAIRWAPEAHSCQVCRGTENAGHRRGVIHSGRREEMPAENRLQNSDVVQCRPMAYCCITLMLDDMRLAPLCSWSAACSVCSLDITRSHSAGGQPIRRADSGAPTHSRNCGWCTCKPNGVSTSECS